MSHTALRREFSDLIDLDASVDRLAGGFTFTGRGQPPKMVENSAQLKKLLAANLSAIGYIDAAEVDPSVRVLNTP